MIFSGDRTSRGRTEKRESETVCCDSTPLMVKRTSEALLIESRHSLSKAAEAAELGTALSGMAALGLMGAAG